MPDFLFEDELWLPRPIDEVFAFFAAAENLQAITPPWLSFQIITDLPIQMGPGTEIDYRLGLHGVPLSWRTLISEWNPPVRFVDEQVRGPYRRWVHEHLFEAGAGGTMSRDRVRYAVPGGALVNALFVRREIEAIFAFRKMSLARLLGDAGG